MDILKAIASELDCSDESEPLATFAEIEKSVILNRLAKFDGNREKTAASLEIGERTLYRKLSEYE